jgi:hypothetical protein
MSKEYTTILDRVKKNLSDNRAGALSDDLTVDVVSVNKGQYNVTPGAEKPAVWVCPLRIGAVRDMAGGVSWQRRPMFRISGAVSGTTQDAVCDNATNLINNIERVLMAHANESGFWSGGTFGWSGGENEDNPEQFGEIILEAGQDVITGHFTLLWSCDIRITNAGTTNVI